ncbi:MAG: hypothetical protein WDO24_10570 [Pseudomonadota bacterium]
MGTGDTPPHGVPRLRARLEIRQAGADRRDLFVVPHESAPQADIDAALAQRVAGAAGALSGRRASRRKAPRGG